MSTQQQLDDDTSTETTPAEQGGFTAPAAAIQRMVDRAAIVTGNNPVHETLYINIGDGDVRFVAGTRANVLVTYADYRNAYLDDVRGEVEALVDVEQFRNYLDAVAGDGRVDVSFYGDDDDRLASKLSIDGELQCDIMLPGSDAALETIPLGIVTAFNDDDIIQNGATGEPLGTRIDTTIEEFERILNVYDLHEEMDLYPIVIQDGELVLAAGDEKEGSIHGTLRADVDGDEDVNNRYSDYFKAIVTSMSGYGGDLVVAIDDNAPICFVRQAGDSTVRHVYGNA